MNSVPFFRKACREGALPPWNDIFGIRSARQVLSDLSEVAFSQGRRFQIDLTAIGAIRPDISIPLWLGLVPGDGLTPVYNLFDRVHGGTRYTQRVTRKHATDFRGGRLTYDDHDGVDFCCPVGTRLVAAAPGHVVMIRDRWLRGGLTVAVDHGGGLVTQYSHCSRPLAQIGQKVRRGDPVALSGASGIDMTLFSPWVPTHVHFMSWYRGIPVDPYLAADEEDRPGTWQRRNNPQPVAPDDKEAIPPFSEVDTAEMERLIDACRSKAIRRELRGLSGNEPALAALLEDALRHDDGAWPLGYRFRCLRPEDLDTEIKLTLPLPPDTYSGAWFADSRMTRPRRTGL